MGSSGESLMMMSVIGAGDATAGDIESPPPPQQQRQRSSHSLELSATAARSLEEGDSIKRNENEDDTDDDHIVPLLSQSQKPKINIFSLSYSRPKSNRQEQITRLAETETSLFSLSVMWVWGGSRYSGLLCVALSSFIYCLMELFADLFSVQPIPLFEIAFARCTVMAIISFVWLKKSGYPVFGPANVRKLLVSRAVVGYISLMSFIYCMQRLPLSQAIVLSFTTPIMASVAARFILHEKIKIAELGGGMVKVGQASDSIVRETDQTYGLVIGLFSSVLGGISYCLVRAGAKASDQPVLTVFSFAVFASPSAAICTFAFQEFVMPGFYSFILMVIMGLLALFAEIFLARGLQLEKTSKIANVQYLEAALSQIWVMGSLTVVPSFGRLVGCLLILASICSTFFVGPEKEVE
ncbi:uncharacterized protein LOC108223821 isoform X3 [Daucus carota subsp. sativus]|uniref:uncharacterized protein LOC108223821 isoform X3 n=1 Tax=Daucus carota subsp. sativus TaxID=79200 RepID=UPI0007EF6559|nr:PREDICTED: uncharacterized protein LOC108223821 isoform X3 [Daucus carota subsp. sativus]